MLHVEGLNLVGFKFEMEGESICYKNPMNKDMMAKPLRLLPELA